MPRFETDDLRQRYALVIEGQCPHGHGGLERRPECGWCERCQMGWSIRGDEVTAYWWSFGQLMYATSDVLNVTLGEPVHY